MIRKLLILFVLLCKYSCTYAQTDIRTPGAQMIDVKFWIDHKMWTNKELKDKRNLFVLIFNPTCEHCMEKTKMLEENLKMLGKQKLVLTMTPDMSVYFKDFDRATDVLKYPKIKIAVDSGDYITRMTNYKGLPQMNIYDKDRKLLKIYNGNFTMDSLSAYIK